MHFKQLRLLVPALAIGLMTLASTTLPAVAGTTTHATHAARQSTLKLPPGARLAIPPRPAAHLHFAHVTIPADSIGCYYNQGIGSLASNKWVSAELGYTGGNKGMLRARATSIGAWEQFDLCYDYTYAYWYMVSVANGLGVSTEMGYTGGNQFMLRARATSIGPWEQYVLACQSNGTLIIGSLASNKWTSTEMGYTGGNQYMLRARATSIGPWEQYVTNTAAIGC